MGARVFVAVAFVGIAVVAAIHAWPRERVQRSTVVVVTRDLHDSGPVAVRRTPLSSVKAPKKRVRGQSQSASSPLQGESPSSRPDGRGRTQSPTRTGARRSPSAKKKHRTPVHTSKPVPAPHSPPSAPPAPSQRPTVDITAPVPAGACLKGLGGVNCG